MDDTTTLPHRIRRRVRTTHGDLLRRIDDCADTTVATWNKPFVTERRHVVEPFRSALDEHGIPDRLPDVLVDVVDTIGHELPARPVSAPPYVVVTSTGILLRATLPPERLSIAIEPFEVVRRPSPTYRRRDETELEVRLG